MRPDFPGELLITEYSLQYYRRLQIGLIANRKEYYDE